MNRILKASYVSYVCVGIVCMALMLLLAWQAFTQPVGKTFLIYQGDSKFEEWRITSPTEMVPTRSFVVPDMGGTPGPSPPGDLNLYVWWNELYLANIDGSNKQHIAHTGGKVIHARWDWTGRQFLFLGQSNRGVWVGEVQPGGSVQARQVAEEVMHASFSPNGQTLLLERWPASGRPGIYLLNLADASERLVSTRVSDGWGTIGYAPEWTADGRYVLFIYNERAYPYSDDPQYQHKFWVLDLVNGREQQLQSTAGPIPQGFSPIFWAGHGGRVLYSTLEKLVSLSIDLQAMTITAVEIIGDREPWQWIDQGKLLLVGGPTVVDLASSQMNIMRPEAPPKKSRLGIIRPLHRGVGAVGPCPIRDDRLYLAKYCRPTEPAPTTQIRGLFSHSNTDSNRCDQGSFNFACQAIGDNDHKGTDFGTSGATGINTYAADSGRVLLINNDCSHEARCDLPADNCGGLGFGGFGNWALIGHTADANGHRVVRTFYAHLRNVEVVQDQDVGVGRVLGPIGDTGQSDRCHLHFEVRWNPDPGLEPQHTHVDPFAGACNWIRGSLWASVDQPCF